MAYIISEHYVQIHFKFNGSAKENTPTDLTIWYFKYNTNNTKFVHR